MYGTHRASGEFAETAFELKQRQKESQIDEGFIGTIDELDHLLSRNECSLENDVIELNDDETTGEFEVDKMAPRRATLPQQKKKKVYL